MVVVGWKNPEPKRKPAPAPRRPITMRATISEAYPFFFLIQELQSTFI